MQKTAEEKVQALVKAFNELMPDHLHIGLVPKWIPEHPEGGRDEED